MDAGMTDQANRLIDWLLPQRCLLLGVAGTGMRALTEILQQAGHIVYGSDVVYQTGNLPEGQTETELPVPDVRMLAWNGISRPDAIDVCICSPAVPETAPLYLWAQRQSIPIMSLHATVGALFADRSQLCVTGTHGKSTTSSLLAWLLNESNRNAGVFIGAPLNTSAATKAAIRGGYYGGGDVAVIEACEFDRSFLNLKPHHVILNGIDGDHFDCFSNAQEEDAAYRNFLELLPSDGTVFLNAACSRSSSLVAQVGTASVQWTLNDRSATDWSGEVLDHSSERMTVRIRGNRRHFGDFRIPLFGQHNVENVLAAVSMASFQGLSAAQCQKALTGFPGLKRRLEFRGEYRQMRMLDDYAHHPTAVTTTLQAVRQQYPEHRIRVIFEPHQMIRLQQYEDQFVRALSIADEVIVFPVFPAREQVSEARCHRISQQLAATIREQETPAVFADGVNSVVLIVEHTGQPQDLFLTMGAGTVHRIHDEVHRRFQQHSAA